jgi:hypothetical protein
LYDILESLKNNVYTPQSKTVPFSSSSTKVDVAFVIDATGSMAPYIANVKENIAAFAQYLSEKEITLRISIVEFQDITYDGYASTIIHKVDGSPWMNLTDFITTLTLFSVKVWRRLA